MEAKSRIQTQQNGSDLEAIRSWAYAQINGRIVNYVACGNDNSSAIAKATLTMRAKFGISREDVERMLTDMYSRHGQGFFGLSIGINFAPTGTAGTIQRDKVTSFGLNLANRFRFQLPLGATDAAAVFEGLTAMALVFPPSHVGALNLSPHSPFSRHC
jgi:hypothetical protein